MVLANYHGGFGFSADDFITGIQLVKGVVQALSDSHGARPCFRSLTAELNTFNGALQEIGTSCVYTTGREMSSFSSSSARASEEQLRQAVKQRQTVIDTFSAKHDKFRRSLGEQEPKQQEIEQAFWSRCKSRLRANWHKIEWVVGRKGEIDELRAKIPGHTTTINTLLISMQSYIPDFTTAHYD